MSQPNFNDPPPSHSSYRDPTSSPPNLTPSTPMFRTPRPARLPLSAFTHPDQFNRLTAPITTINESAHEPSIDCDDIDINQTNSNPIDINEHKNINIQNNETQPNNHQEEPTYTCTEPTHDDVNMPEVQQYVLQMEQQQLMLEQQVQQQREEIANLRYQQAWQYQQQTQRPAHHV